MKLNKTMLGVALVALALSSCEDSLNYNEYTAYDKAYIDRNFNYVGGFITKIYNDLDSDFGNLGGAMLSSATDESEYSGYNATGNTIEDFLNGNWSPANPHLTIWSQAYDGITYCNEFLDNWTGLTFDEFKMNQDYYKQMFQYNNYQWEVRWARAYFYFILVRQYGSVPFKIHNGTGDEDTALPCTSYDEIFKFIDDECNAIKDQIVEDYTEISDYAYTTVETGRASRFAVLALRAQAALYHASPLFNPNNDVELWRQAALANKELIDACEAKGKKLASTYSNLWSSDFYSNSDVYDELLFARRVAASTSVEQNNFPVGYSSGRGGNCPTQDLVDAYDCTDGLPITESPLYDPQNPYANRDPRLGMTVAHNGEAWPNDITNTSYATLQTYTGGAHARPTTAYATPTGYYLKKLLYNGCILRSGYTTAATYHGWLTFRLGGMYLNYAEAVFQYFKNAGSPRAADVTTDVFPVSARELASKTRTRVGMPEIADHLSNEAFWEAYKRERQVELAFEGHRFYDIRRWKEDGNKFLNIHRMVITQNEDGTLNYQTVPYTRGDGQWQEKWNLFPFSQTEIQKSGGAILQNKGW